MTFLFPRVVSIRRMRAKSAVGAVGYGGVAEDGEDIIFDGLMANIAEHRERQSMPSGVPANSESRTGWKVNIPIAMSPPAGSIVERDIVQDDTGKRYIINGAGWTSLGWRLITQLLEA